MQRLNIHKLIIGAIIVGFKNNFYGKKNINL